MAVQTIIASLSDRDSELFNIVTGKGPGEGLNRMQVTLQDEASIESYGERRTIVDFPNIADYDDLVSKTQDYLDKHKNPLQELEVVYNYDHRNPPSFERGDTIRVADLSLGYAVTAEIQELDWNFEEVVLYLGTPAYNLIDELIREPERKRKREIALGLPVPTGFRAQKAFPGINVAINPYSNSRARGVEIYASTESGFIPDRSYLLAKGNATRWEFAGLESGVIYYFRARSYDDRGAVSEFTDEVSAIAGYVDGGRIEEGTLDITPFASELRPPRNVLNLPDVTLTSGYLVGDLVVYDDGDGPRLYELQTLSGVPENDWEMMTAEDLADKSIAHQIVAGQIIAGAIGADEIAANAITADKIAAGTIDIRNATGMLGVQMALDGGFEESLTDNWNIQGSTGAWSRVTSTLATEGDAYALHNAGNQSGTSAIWNGAGAYLSTESFMAAKAGDRIVASVMAQKAGADPYQSYPQLRIRFYAENGSILATTPVSMPVTTNWKRYEAEAIAPANTRYFNVGVYIASVNAGHNVLTRLDDFQVYRAAVYESTHITATGVEVRDAGIEQLKLGRISGKPGVPNGFDFGLWGVLGSGVFIQGVPKIIQVDPSSTYSNTVSATRNAGQNQGAFGHTSLLNSWQTYTVPEGRKLILAVASRGHSAYVDTFNYSKLTLGNHQLGVRTMIGGSWGAGTPGVVTYSAGTTIQDVQIEHTITAGVITTHTGTFTLESRGLLIAVEVDA